ncbi:hypothetical protein CI109_100410 [Kwoniella shandongensis]|uniref:Uncharacterized protein n=1 Tax=Kwoniella shandongensis TaxID=1734106 RepID=A0A5M6C3T1_9TREE|nr:uncharacterized protein CI109_001747 [Kwoniella shandongensis]KAA5529807.1 hypothetical protein CI109_001747 [Kwoniella shandongensis]
MEVDNDRPLTDDERMDEDYEEGQGVGHSGSVKDDDGDAMMIGEEEEEELIVEEEGEMEAEPIVSAPQNIIIPPPTSNPFISTPPLATPSSTTYGITANPFGKPLESPPAPETEMTPVHEDESTPVPVPALVATAGGDGGEGGGEGVERDAGSGDISLSPVVPQTEEVPSHDGAEGAEDDSSAPQEFITVPEPRTALPLGESSQSGSLVPIPAVATESNGEDGVGEHMDDDGSGAVEHADVEGAEDDDGEEEYYEADEEEHDIPIEGEAVEQEGDNSIDEEDDEAEEEEEDEDYPIDATSLPPIILHLPSYLGGARTLFAPLESDPAHVPVWLQDRQLELAEASLADVWSAIRAECAKEGLVKNGGLVIEEKQMDLKMNEDDVNLQSITFLELIHLHHGCGLPTPVQLYLSWETSRFITRFNAIQAELDAVNDKQSESDEAAVDLTEGEAAFGGEEDGHIVAEAEEGAVAGENDEAIYEEDYEEGDEVEEYEEYEEETGSKKGVEAEESYETTEGEAKAEPVLGSEHGHEGEEDSAQSGEPETGDDVNEAPQKHDDQKQQEGEEQRDDHGEEEERDGDKQEERKDGEEPTGVETIVKQDTPNPQQPDMTESASATNVVQDDKVVIAEEVAVENIEQPTAEANAEANENDVDQAPAGEEEAAEEQPAGNDQTEAAASEAEPTIIATPTPSESEASLTFSERAEAYNIANRALGRGIPTIPEEESETTLETVEQKQGEELEAKVVEQPAGGAEPPANDDGAEEVYDRDYEEYEGDTAPGSPADTVHADEGDYVPDTQPASPFDTNQEYDEGTYEDGDEEGSGGVTEETLDEDDELPPDAEGDGPANGLGFDTRFDQEVYVTDSTRNVKRPTREDEGAEDGQSMENKRARTEAFE